MITGLWSTCQSAGNILGLQIAPLLLDQWQGRWFCLMFVIAVTYACVGVMMFTFLVPDPREVGISMPREEPSVAGSVLEPPSEGDQHLLMSLSDYSLPIVEPDSEPSDRQEEQLEARRRRSTSLRQRMRRSLTLHWEHLERSPVDGLYQLGNASQPR